MALGRTRKEKEVREERLGRVWGFSSFSTNTALEATHQQTMKIHGLQDGGEYLDWFDEWSYVNYNLDAINKTRKKLKLPSLKESAYYCKNCRNMNNPFNYENWKGLLEKNICFRCEENPTWFMKFKEKK